MASSKTEELDRPSRSATVRDIATRRERASVPASAAWPVARRRRREVRDLLGDYSEQTGAFFG